MHMFIWELAPMWRCIIVGLVAILGYGGICTLIIVVHKLDYRDRREIVDAIRRRGVIVKSIDHKGNVISSKRMGQVVDLAGYREGNLIKTR